MAKTAEIIATRKTADGVTVEMYADGALTGAYGMAIPGVPCTGRTLAAARLLIDEVCLFTAAEMPALYRAAVQIAKRGGTPGDLRAAADAICN
jgi:hypothetical protein